MAYKFNEDKIKDYINTKPDSEELAALEEEYLAGFDPDEILLAHKQELEDLDELLDTLKTIDKEFDPAFHAREAAENAYSMAIYLMCHLARRFHPLQPYGRELLAQAKALRKRYEKLYEAPMVTGINKENSEAFAELISPDVMEQINTGRYKGLGYFKTEVNRLVPVGAAAYEWVDIPKELEDGNALGVKWLYVSEDYREQSISDHIMAELVNLMIEKGASSINFCVPVDEDYEKWLTLFSEWRFGLKTDVNPEFRCNLSDMSNRTGFAKAAEKAVSLSEADHLSVDEVIRKYLKSADAMFLADRYVGRGDYYEPDLSCFTGRESAPTGILLAHISPSGQIYIEYIDCLADTAESMKNMLSLIAHCFISAVEKYDKKTEVIMYPESEELEEYLDVILPKQRVTPVINASLVPEEGEEVTEEMVNAMIDYLDEH